MEEMIGYVFGGLQRVEDELKNVGKALKRQKRTNSNLIILALGCAIYISALENQRKEEKAKSKELLKEVNMMREKLTMHDLRLKELETLKGEAKM